MTRRAVLLVLLAVLAAGVGPLHGMGVAAADENQPPLAEAGLDQQVSENTTVYLDAGGSVDPDGSIERYHWTITAPNGTQIEPDCQSCSQTTFDAVDPGKYTATIEVTDDDGATKRDTLYVEVEHLEDPSVTLRGPSATLTGETVQYEATATKGDRDLRTIRWYADGNRIGRQQVDTDQAVTNQTATFTTATEHRVVVEVTDTAGQTARAVQNVTVKPTSQGGGGGEGTTTFPTMSGGGGSSSGASRPSLMRAFKGGHVDIGGTTISDFDYLLSLDDGQFTLDRSDELYKNDFRDNTIGRNQQEKVVLNRNDVGMFKQIYNGINKVSTGTAAGSFLKISGKAAEQLNRNLNLAGKGYHTDSHSAIEKSDLLGFETENNVNFTDQKSQRDHSVKEYKYTYEEKIQKETTKEVTKYRTERLPVKKTREVTKTRTYPVKKTRTVTKTRTKRVLKHRDVTRTRHVPVQKTREVCAASVMGTCYKWEKESYWTTEVREVTITESYYETVKERYTTTESYWTSETVEYTTTEEYWVTESRRVPYTETVTKTETKWVERETGWRRTQPSGRNIRGVRRIDSRQVNTS